MSATEEASATRDNLVEKKTKKKPGKKTGTSETPASETDEAVNAA